MTLRSCGFLSLLAVTVAVPTLLQAQTFQREYDSVPLSFRGAVLEYPWIGGLNTLTVALGDIDGDGDLDLLLTGTNDFRIQLYRNDGGGASGDFVFASPDLVGTPIYDRSNVRIALTDIDGDNDLDLFGGQDNGRILLFRNTGTAFSPAFTFETDFFDSIDVGYQAAPAFADVNGDGEKDLLVGEYNSGVHLFLRTPVGPRQFAAADTLRNTTGTIIKPPGIFFVPGPGDLDGDGDIDLLLGCSNDLFVLVRNTGTSSAPQFVVESANYLPGADLRFRTPVLADIDGDMDSDLFFGNNEGIPAFYRNLVSPTPPAFERVPDVPVIAYLDVGFYSAPALADLDGDGLLDLTLGTGGGDLHLFRNTGTAQSPAFTWQTGNLVGNPGIFDANPTWVDLNDDGLLDLVLSNSGGLLLYGNSGTPAAPVLDSLGLLKDSAGVAIASRNADLVDIDGDGDLDLFGIGYDPAGNTDVVRWYENTGRSDSAAFSIRSDSLRDAGGAVIRKYDSALRFADIDNDGDFDLLIGISDGYLDLHRNSGTRFAPVFEPVESFFGMIETGSNNRIRFSLGDLDGDSDLDVIAGRFQGGLFFYRNTTPVLSAGKENTPRRFRIWQNYPNPFNPVTTIRYELPSRGHVTLTVFNLLGEAVVTLVDRVEEAGTRHHEFDARAYASGVYLYRLSLEGVTQTRKMLLLR